MAKSCSAFQLVHVKSHAWSQTHVGESVGEPFSCDSIDTMIRSFSISEHYEDSAVRAILSKPSKESQQRVSFSLLLVTVHGCSPEECEDILQ